MALNISISSKFKDAFQEKCFSLLIAAYKTTLTEKKIQLNWDENDISTELHEHITKNEQRIEWHISSNVEAHKATGNLGIQKVKGYSSKLPRIDFRFTTFQARNEYEYFFEAKRLKTKDSHLKRRYINTGINSFISGKYSNGCLIGYVLSGSVSSNISSLNSLLLKDKRESETLEHVTHPLHNSFYESHHKNLGSLKHLLLDFKSLS